MQLLDIVHPAARILTDIARSQDAEVGDGTTSVVVLAGEILKEIKDHVEQGVSSQTIVKGLRRASAMAVNKVKEIAVNTSDSNKRETLGKLAGTAMSSKLIKRNTSFFTKSWCACKYSQVMDANSIQWLSTLSCLSTKTTSTRSSLESRKSPAALLQTPFLSTV
jgi:T-complex protein 1 subunit eta